MRVLQPRPPLLPPRLSSLRSRFAGLSVLPGPDLTRGDRLGPPPAGGGARAALTARWVRLLREAVTVASSPVAGARVTGTAPDSGSRVSMWSSA